MCGFGGVINSDFNLSENEVIQIAQKVSFRGPDNTCIKLFDSSLTCQNFGIHAFFFNRLAIIDLDSRSNQPFEDNESLLLFNGEIYNYRELRNDLMSRGCIFKTTSDTEVLFWGLKEYGKKIISRLNGMFSLFFFNKITGEFIAARDRLGVKPFLFSVLENTFYFASEIDSIIRLSKRNFDISHKATNLYLSLQYIPTPFTIWNKIFKLPPGTYIESSVSELNKTPKISPVAYWDFYTSPLVPNLADNHVETLEKLLENSLQLQLQSDVPIGLFLSSGVDSSLLAAILNKEKYKENVYDFFTVGFNEVTLSDESKDAYNYISSFNNPRFNHHTLNIESKTILNSFEKIYNYVDEPFADSAILLNFCISKKAHEHVKVVLSGDGADELFWGYPRYTEWQSRINRNSRYPLLDPIRKIASSIKNKRIKNSILFRLENNPLDLYLKLVSMRYSDIDFLKDSECWWRENLDGYLEDELLPSIIDTKTYLPDCMFFKVDRASMGASIEVRVPYIDNDIIDFSRNLKIRDKSSENFSNKALLKSLLVKLAPHYKIDQVKKGFSFPLSKWLNNEWKEISYDLITKKNLEQFNLDTRLVDLLDKNFSKKQNFTYEIWYLLNLMLWKERVFK